MTLVKDLMTKDVRVCFPTDTIFKAAEIMAVNDLGLLVVVDDDPRFIPRGIITDTDILKRIVLKEKNPKLTLVQDIMTKSMTSISSDETATNAAQKMFQYRVKRLPVVDDKRLVGIISHKDLLETFVNYKKKLLDLALEF